MLRPNFKRRFLRYGLRSLLIGMVAVAMVSAYVGNTVRAYKQEQQAFARIPSLTITEPGY